MQETWDEFVTNIGEYGPNLVGAIALLIVGLLVAWVVAALVRRALRNTTLDNRIAAWMTGSEHAQTIEAEEWISKGVFWLILLFVIVGFLQILGLTIVTTPLNRMLDQLLGYIPRILAAGLLLLLAWISASIARVAVTHGLRAANIDERISDQEGAEPAQGVSLAKSLGDAAYWLVFLLFLPAILDALDLQGLLEPVQSMFNEILAFLPNLLAAGLILLVGWFVARIVQRIIANLLAAVGVNRLGSQVGLDSIMGQYQLSDLVGLIVYALILIPVLVAALNALEMEAITAPASRMLDQILSAIPAIFAAALLLLIAYIVARVVAGLIANLLAGLGFNRVLERLGLTRGLSAETEGMPESTSPAEIVGYLVIVAIMLFASIEALRLLNFDVLATGLAQFTNFLGQVLLGLIIFAIGLYLSNLAARMIRSSGAEQSGLLALTARIAILVLAGAMALREMGLASDIVNLAFGLLLGAIAVAVALAFGLGGRDIAARQLEEWRETIQPETQDTT
jgi:hypothetical protein